MGGRYSFGPVPSRRLGRSLGVSIIPPKYCSYSCVYCQLGRTNRLSVTRRSFYDRKEILDDVADSARGQSFDYITFAGDGEPTLSTDLGWLLEGCATLGRTAVITNGSLLADSGVRAELGQADVVMPSLDAGDSKTFRSINRPHPRIDFGDMLEGLERLVSEGRTRVWVEVMLVAGVNDSIASLESLADALAKVSPERVFIGAPIRPPAEEWVRVPSSRNIMMAMEMLGAEDSTYSETGEFGWREFESAEEAILRTAGRHPLRLEQARSIEASFNSEVVDALIGSGRLAVREYGGRSFLVPAGREEG